MRSVYNGESLPELSEKQTYSDAQLTQKMYGKSIVVKLKKDENDSKWERVSITEHRHLIPVK